METGGIASVADGAAAGSEWLRRCHLSIRTRVGGQEEAKNGCELQARLSVGSQAAAMALCGFQLAPAFDRARPCAPRSGTKGDVEEEKQEGTLVIA